jgi:hypothetical protein
LGARIPRRALVGSQPPTQYSDDDIGDTAVLLECYDGSIAFYRELVEVEGRVEFAPRIGCNGGCKGSCCRASGDASMSVLQPTPMEGE